MNKMLGFPFPALLAEVSWDLSVIFFGSCIWELGHITNISFKLCCGSLCPNKRRFLWVGASECQVVFEVRLL